MTCLYILDVCGLDWQRVLPRLPSDRQEKVKKLRKESDKIRSAGAGLLLQYALEQAGVPKDRQALEENPLGKPHLRDFPNIHFSLSHSGKYAVCAVGDSPLGVDVEQPRCTMEIARRFFHETELPETEDKDYLLRLWTAKEAFVKALGGGLTIPLNSFRVRLTKTEAMLEQKLSPLPYSLQEFTAGDCRICLCATEPADEPVMMQPDSLY